MNKGQIKSITLASLDIHTESEIFSDPFSTLCRRVYKNPSTVIELEKRGCCQYGLLAVYGHPMWTEWKRLFIKSIMFQEWKQIYALIHA